jgi:hypothetical protein
VLNLRHEVNYFLTSCMIFMFCWPCIWYNSCKRPTWRTFPFSIYLFKFSTCFKQTRAHNQENQSYQYNIWYVSLCVGDRPVSRSGRSSFPTCILDGQSDTLQMLYWYNWFSWLWARVCLKHVENWNKQIGKQNCASGWSFTRIIPRCTVNRT